MIKPILFNTDMVRAIIDGRKKVTRRLLKVQPHVYADKMFKDGVLKSPCQPGDILWVRETFCWCPCWDCPLRELPERARVKYDMRDEDGNVIGSEFDDMALGFNRCLSKIING